MRRPVLTEIVPKMSNSAILKQTGVLARSVLDVQDDIRRGYCVDTVGLDSNKIRKYVKYQETKERKAERRRKLFLLIGATPPCLLRGQGIVSPSWGFQSRPLLGRIVTRICPFSPIRSNFGEVTVLYGARTPADLVFKDDLAAWAGKEDLNVIITVDRGDSEWKGEIGPVTHLWKKATIYPSTTKAIICGPPVMISFVVSDLLKMGFNEDDIITTLERHMKCGVGKCGHCSIGSKFTCIDGPVFTYRQLKELQ